MPLISPPFLKPGDTVAIMCMAGKTKLEFVQKAKEILQNEGYQVIVGKTVGAENGVFGGDDAMRKGELQSFLDNPNIRAIISARGGYGVTRYVDELDFEAFKKNPKWIVGFSDITALISHINNLGIEAIHGPMAKMFQEKKSKKSAQFLLQILEGKTVQYHWKVSPANTLKTEIVAPLVGGNLCILAHCIGSKSEIDTDDTILFIEDVGEYYYNIDRMLVQLDRAGKFRNVKAVLVGQFTDCKDSENPFGQNIPQIISTKMAKLGIPVVFGFEAGHELYNLPWISGREAHMSIKNNQIELKIN